jgi:uncharacterized membrane protein YdjX (TVP38/TMEM64 family)
VSKNKKKIKKSIKTIRNFISNNFELWINSSKLLPAIPADIVNVNGTSFGIELHYFCLVQMIVAAVFNFNEIAHFKIIKVQRIGRWSRHVRCFGISSVCLTVCLFVASVLSLFSASC